MTNEISTTGRVPLSRGQVVTVVVYGVVLWFLAALTCRFLAPMGVFDGMNRVILYAAIWPGTVPFVFLAMKIARLSRSQIGIAYSIATAAAMLCDGVALAWFPALYGTKVEYIAASGAVILWGAGVGIILACLWNKADN